MAKLPKANITESLLNGARKLCPKCGKGKLFQRWGVLVDNCENCGLVIRNREPETWFFMYMSTAAITGIFIIALFLISPDNELLGKILVAAIALGAFFATQEMRKGIAIAIDYIVDNRSRHQRY